MVALTGNVGIMSPGALSAAPQSALSGTASDGRPGIVMPMTFTPVRPERRIAIPASRRSISIPDA